MSYLRGPLTREQITTLMADRRSRPVAAEPVGDTSPPADAAPAAPSPALAEDATPVMPTVAEGVAVRWLDPAAPWATQVGAVPTSTRFAAAIVATVDLLFDDTKADLRHTEQAECVLFPLGDPPDVASLVAVDHDPRDLRPAAPSDATYELPVAKLSTKAAVHDGAAHDRRAPPGDAHRHPVQQPRAEAGQPARRDAGGVRRALRRRRGRRGRRAGRRPGEALRGRRSSALVPRSPPRRTVSAKRRRRSRRSRPTSS